MAACVQVRQAQGPAAPCRLDISETWTLYLQLVALLSLTFVPFLQQVRLVQQEQRQDRCGEGEALLHVPHRQGITGTHIYMLALISHLATSISVRTPAGRLTLMKCVILNF